MSEDKLPVIVFFDGGCGLCSREISVLKKLDTNSNVRWINIDENGALLESYGISYIDAMRRFHVVNQQGQIEIGVAGFLCLWRVLPTLKWVPSLVRFTRSKGFLEHCYQRFADKRFKSRLAGTQCVAVNANEMGKSA
jgi:predicted DCC family thiol-disulfide oxidoreductase YuxK